MRLLEAAPKRFVRGETLPYLGRNVRLLVESADVTVAGGPLRSLAVPGGRAEDPEWRCTLRVYSPRRSQDGIVTGLPSGYLDVVEPLVAPARPKREVADSHQRPAPTMG